MTNIKATIIADSLSPQGHRITSMILEYPRIIHSEFMTHRMFSRNAASSRAVPFKTMVEEVENNPFIPIAWQKDHSGMQGTEYFNANLGSYVEQHRNNWLIARDNAVKQAKILNKGEVTKQLCNRLLEPFMNYKVLVTATEFDNFFKLRCPEYVINGGSYNSKKDAMRIEPEKDTPAYDDILAWLKLNESQAEIHIQALAEAMWDAMNESTPKQLKAGEWHIPFGDVFNLEKLIDLVPGDVDDEKEYVSNLKVKISTARCARISYLNFEGKDDYQADIKLFDRLKAMQHASPFEHCAQVMSDDEYETFNSGQLTKIVVENEYWESFDLLESNNNIKGWCRNFRGFIQLRHQLNL